MEQTQTLEQPEVEVSPDFYISIWNDEKSITEYVMVLLQRVFGMDELEAYDKVEEVQSFETAVVWEGPLEEGQILMTKCNSVKLEYHDKIGNLQITLQEM